ncbi:hypothetical protein BJX66DRAFT_349913 [Aspergillus keveii]|uniref:Uncharacterized protein n=1 Tax=Aspergillus keveii TaxID=714993 RepID=A0ABR4FIH9_9EURO
MDGTILITGANGSLAHGFLTSLLSHYPSFTVIGTVRNPSATDPAMTKLKALIGGYPAAKFHLPQLDLGSLSEVREFSMRLARDIQEGKIPRLSSIICNAFTWSLSGGPKFSADGFETTFQVSHLAHHLLVLELLASMDPNSGRIVMIGSVTHDPDRANPLSKLLAHIPEDLEQLVHPAPDKPGEEHDRGFQCYGTAKLTNVMFVQELNDRLAKDPVHGSITALAMDPGGIVDSRAHGEQKMLVRVLMSATKILLPLLHPFTRVVRSAEDSGADLVQIAVGSKFHGRRGYFEGLVVAKPAWMGEDVEKRRRLWDACCEWSGLGEVTGLGISKK